MIVRSLPPNLPIIHIIICLSLDAFRRTILSCSSPWLCHTQCVVFLRQSWTGSRNYRPGGASRSLIVCLIAHWRWRVTQPFVDRRKWFDTIDPARRAAMVAIHG